MNIFLLSPGRTGTTTLSEAFNCVDGFTSSHESRTTKLGFDRVDYPDNHIECDNRLIWFLPRLREKYASEGILVKVVRDYESIARSYDRRWRRINIMKAYSQGILLRDLCENNLDVCRDYVVNCYEHIDAEEGHWDNFIELDLSNPRPGVEELLGRIDAVDVKEQVLSHLGQTKSNLNIKSSKDLLNVTWHNLRLLVWDIFKYKH